MIQFSIRTAKSAEFVDITIKVQSAVGGSKIRDGVCTVFVPHTTAAVTINEGHDPAVASDILAALGNLVPRSGKYAHAEGNSDAHIKSVLVGQSVTLPVQRGKMILGTWQKIFFCEFDGPRERMFFVEVLAKG